MNKPIPQNGTYHDCFALLDDSSASSVAPTSRLYQDYAGNILCEDASELPLLFQKMEEEIRNGLFAVGLFTYELGGQLLKKIPMREPSPSSLPMAQILLFRRCDFLSTQAVQEWLDQYSQASDMPSGVTNLRASVNEQEFEDAFTHIRTHLEAGNTYQVNYTFQFHFKAYGPVPALYARLRSRQRVPYGALITLPNDQAVLSLSPELFIRHSDGIITAKPMKGTAPACDDEQENQRRAETLVGDEKTRAENLMIVDLLRNDLNRIAEIGSVQVPKLFEVTRYSQVLQMTSTVTAKLRQNVSLNDIFQALYPCGSITGAPKLSTMKIIRELEPHARGIYTGAIGWFDAPGLHSAGDFCFSVPIRTLMLNAASEDGWRIGEMGVGAGILHDSSPKEEYVECLLKARFLTELPSEFKLIETIFATHAGCRHLSLHLQRLEASARYFGFSYNEEKISSTLQKTCERLPETGAYRLRLILDQQGSYAIDQVPLTALTGPVRVLIASNPVDLSNPFLRHKTTVREQYDRMWKNAQSRGAFDTLFCNMEGNLVEGGRSSVFVQLNGQWYTPPLSSGALPGVMRAVLLNDTSWNASERDLTLDDLRAAQQVVVCNAVRGPLQATIEW